MKIDISKRQHKLINRTIESYDSNLELGFINRQLAILSFPYRDINTDLTKPYQYEKKNGLYKLRIISPIGVGVPYGIIPRQIYYYVISQAVQTRQQEIFLGHSFNEFMKNINNHLGGYHTRVVKNQIRRMAYANVSLEKYNVVSDSVSLIKLDLADSFELWRKDSSPNQQEIFKPYIRLKKEFFDDIINAPIPVPVAMVKSFSTALELDLLFWLSHRMFSINRLNKSQKIKYKTLELQFGSDYKRLYDFKRKFLIALKNVQLVWQDLKLNVDSRDFLEIKPSKLLVNKVSHGA